jgi:predicted metalloprotease with PDZ domain
MLRYALSVGGSLPQSISVNLYLPIDGSSVREFYLPYYRPGRYHPASYVKHIYGLEALDEQNEALELKKTGINTWEISQTKRLHQIRYQYRCVDFDAGGSWLGKDLFYINPVNILLMPKGLENEPISLAIQQLPDLQAIYPPQLDLLHFGSYFEAIDTPVVAAAQAKSFTWQQEQSHFHLHLVGDLPLPYADLPRLFQAFAHPMAALFGGFPFSRYDYIVFCTPETRYHGVEHRNCTVITLPYSEDKAQNLKHLLGIASHELFHAWNVCRLRPKVLRPYHLSAPLVFDEGYALEGFTTYYGDLMLLRAGLLDRQGFIEEMNGRLQAHYSHSGRHFSSLIDSSRNLWANAYDKVSLETEVSIYTKGMLAAWVTDLAIKKGSKGKKSLDDVLRAMWLQFPEDGPGYTHEEVRHLVKQAGGKEAEERFIQAVCTKKPLEEILPELLAGTGMHLVHTEEGRFRLESAP